MTPGMQNVLGGEKMSAVLYLSRWLDREGMRVRACVCIACVYECVCVCAVPPRMWSQLSDRLKPTSD